MAEGLLASIESLRFNPLISGVYAGFEDVGNATTLEITQGGEIKTRPSRQRSTYGAARSTVAVGGPAALKLGFNDMGPVELAYASHATPDAFSQSADPTQSESVTLILNKWVDIDPQGRGNLDTVAISGKTEGTDYAVDLVLGQIKALQAGTAGAQTVTYNVGARTGYLIEGGSRTTIRGAIVANCINLDGERPFVFRAWDAVLRSSAALNLLSEDFAAVELSGNLNVPAGKPSAYEILYEVAD